MCLYRPLFVVLLGAACLFVFGEEARAATITVTSTEDYPFGPGPKDGDGKGCTLRKALRNANDGGQTFMDCAAGESSLNVIQFSVSSITLGDYGSPLYVSRNLEISGSVTIDANGEDGIFKISSSGKTLAIDGLTLTGAASSAIKIANSGSHLIATNCAFTNNTSSRAGGAIDSVGTIDVSNCTFVGNRSNSSTLGGGAIRVSAPGLSTISLSTFTSNSTSGSGGAVHFSSSATLSSLNIVASNCMQNSADAVDGSAQGGGAVWQKNGVLAVESSLFTSNSVSGDEGRGGAIYLGKDAKPALLSRNLFTSNSVDGQDALGGAIFSEKPTLAEGNSFLYNAANNDGRGGAIATNSNRPTILSMETPGFLLSNSTLHGNTAARGGGIYVFGPEFGSYERGITLVNVTIDHNDASDPNGGGGLYADEAQTNQPPVADIRNSILSDNRADSVDNNCDSAITGFAFVNGGGNLFWPAASCMGAPVFAVQDVGDPLLDGPTPASPPILVMPLQEGSAAAQHGLSSICGDFPVLNLDQRLEPRPQPGGSACDAGAVESDVAPPGPALVLAPPTGLAFGSVPVGTTVSQTAIVSNPGQLELTGLALAVSGAGYTLASQTCGATLAAGQQCSAVVQANPSAGGSFNGNLVATGDGGRSASIALSGSGFVASPGLNVMPGSIDFGEILVGQQSSNLNLQVENTGNVDLNNLQFAVAAPFESSQSGSCGASLPAGTSCNMRFRFSPTAAQHYAATLTVTTDQGANATALFTGVGLAPAELVIAPGSVSFGRVAVGTSSSTVQVTLTNIGTKTASGLGMVFGGSSSPTIARVSDDCPIDLLGGQSCHIGFRLAANGSGAVTADFVVAFNSSTESSNTLALSGVGYDPAELTLVPHSPIDFGRVLVGNSAAVVQGVRNTGGENLQLQTVVVSDPFSLRFNQGCSLPRKLVPGETCNFLVTVSPSLPGESRGVLTARGTRAAAADGEFEDVSDKLLLRVEGYTPGDLVLTPGDGLAFGPVPLGEHSNPQAATLLNPGSDPVDTVVTSLSSASFQILQDDCPITLAGGASCQVQVVAAPAPGSAAGSFVGNLDASGVPMGQAMIARSIPLSARAFDAEPDLGAQPDAIDFGSVTVGVRSGNLTAYLQNLGASPLELGIGLVGDASFQIASDGCTGTLDPGALCEVALYFQPTATGLLSTRFVASTLTGGRQELDVRGTGIDQNQPALQTSPASPGPLGFAGEVGETLRKAVQVSNVGSASLTLGQPLFTGLEAADFSVDSPLPLELAPGASASLEIICVPDGAGLRSALLTLTSTDPAKASIPFALSCNAVDPLYGNGFED